MKDTDKKFLNSLNKNKDLMENLFVQIRQITCMPTLQFEHSIKTNSYFIQNIESVKSFISIKSSSILDIYPSFRVAWKNFYIRDYVSGVVSDYRGIDPTYYKLQIAFYLQGKDCGNIYFEPIGDFYFYEGSTEWVFEPVKECILTGHLYDK